MSYIISINIFSSHSLMILTVTNLENNSLKNNQCIIITNIASIYFSTPILL